ncbi:MAG: hypothetical protein ACR2LV_01455 [Solirubrobacteraceae bacterium]
MRRTRPGSAEHSGTPSSATGPGQATASGRAQPRSPSANSDRRHGGPPQDHALYNCQCGFVFQAPVTTSVGCPHCGNTQAW